jgi:hypothetical protein
MPNTPSDWADSDPLVSLPGEALVRAGLADLAAGRRSAAACLVEIARPRLTQAGLVSPQALPPSPEPERELYRLLRAEGGDAYSRYNALLRELVSFELALDRRIRERAGRSAGQTQSDR